jgi:hypothetical protein
MAVGDANDILSRIRHVTARRWWNFTSPIRDAVVGGLGNGAAWCYSWITYAKLQSRLATATGVWLDLISFDFLGRDLPRNGLPDSTFRTLIDAHILQERVTRKGMTQVLTALLGMPPKIIEPWNPGDCGAYGYGTFAYGKAGCWGSMQLPGQVFMQISRAPQVGAGVPNVAGYKKPGNTSSMGLGGYGQGQIQYIGVQVGVLGVTDAVIEAAIKSTKPTGVICWIQFK